MPSLSGWAAVGPQPYGAPGTPLAAGGVQGGGAGGVALLAAPRAQAPQVHGSSPRSVRAGAGAGAAGHGVAGPRPSPAAGWRWRISAAWVISSSSKAIRTPEMDMPAALARSMSLYGRGWVKRRP
jgi:hypothetical protein